MVIRISKTADTAPMMTVVEIAPARVGGWVSSGVLLEEKGWGSWR
jgi:hypothetical protein